MKFKVYIASELGFSEAGRSFYYKELVPKLQELGLEILDPWTLTPESLINESKTSTSLEERKTKWKETNKIIAENNQKAIESCDILLAVLDGSDPNSGVCAELGYAAAKGKVVFAYRGDFRLCGDNEGAQVNLQVEHFIYQTKGTISTSLTETLILNRNYGTHN
ncbi:MAG: nucleoside 2-deoxyribosyltransferase [Nanoarchaeota archaeon]|nr:nucleoside 2-deoxyribosyltransferase [Nanoarchaeota archaeon]